jgi:hypothetical protein
LSIVGGVGGVGGYIVYSGKTRALASGHANDPMRSIGSRAAAAIITPVIQAAAHPVLAKTA